VLLVELEADTGLTSKSVVDVVVLLLDVEDEADSGLTAKSVVDVVVVLLLLELENEEVDELIVVFKKDVVVYCLGYRAPPPRQTPARRPRTPIAW